MLIDIAAPPHGKLTLFNLYMALSWSYGRDSIHLLRDFDDNVFKATHDPILLEEDNQLDELDRRTSMSCAQIVEAREEMNPVQTP